jgi:hypothetical protein
MKGAADLWRPLRTPIFRQLLLADIVSDIGTFMQGVGSAWLMVSIGASPLFVALTQTASTLPFFLFALPAGAIGDIVDRRALILYARGMDALRRDCNRGDDDRRAQDAGAASRWRRVHSCGRTRTVRRNACGAGDAVEQPWLQTMG